MNLNWKLKKESDQEPVDTSKKPQLSLEKPKEAEGNPPIVNSNVPGRMSTKDERPRGTKKAKAKRTKPSKRQPSLSTKKRAKKVQHHKRRRQKSPSPSSSSSSSSSSDSETDSEVERLHEQQRQLKRLTEENDLPRIRMASKKKSRDERKRPLPPPIADDENLSNTGKAPPCKKREPYLPKSEKTEHIWDLAEDQRVYLQRFINTHYTDEELKEIIVNKPPPSNIKFVKENDTYVAKKYSEAANAGQKSKDQSFKAIQTRIGKVMGPLGKVWEQLVSISKGEAESDVNVNDFLLDIEQAIIMLGQSVNYVSHQRRIVALKCYGYDKQEDIRDLLRNHLPRIENDPEFLFGESFSKQLADSSKNDKKTEEALSKNSKEKGKKGPIYRRDTSQDSHANDRGRTMSFHANDDYYDYPKQDYKGYRNRGEKAIYSFLSYFQRLEFKFYSSNLTFFVPNTLQFKLNLLSFFMCEGQAFNNLYVTGSSYVIPYKLSYIPCGGKQ